MNALNRWRPTKHERFFYLNPAGSVRVGHWDIDLPLCRALWKAGNCFSARQEAKDYSQQFKRLLLSRFR